MKTLMTRDAQAGAPTRDGPLGAADMLADPAELAGRTRGIVLAGVHDWGGCALGAASPRPLVPIANRPLIGYVLEWLHKHGIREICICANSDTRYLRRYLGPRTSFADIEFYEDVMPRGPAGCARDAWCDSACDRMLLVDGTIVPQLDLHDLLLAHVRARALASVAVSRHDLLDDCDDTILVPEGVYVFDERVRSFIPARGHCDVKESLLPSLHASGERTMAFEARVASPRVADTRRYADANEWVVARLCEQPEPPSGYQRVGEALIHEDSHLEDATQIIGPVLIGPSCRIGRAATIVGPVSLGSHVQVGAEAVICRSALWDRCHVGMRARMDRCVVTHGARVPPGAQLRGSVLQGVPFGGEVPASC